jgi:hypothetical protein
VHVAVDVAIERATARAYTTGRWTSPSFVRECDEGLRKHTHAVWSAVRARGGTTVVIDNSGPKGACAVVIGDGAPPLLESPTPVRAARDLGLEAELLSHTRVQAFAEARLASLGLVLRDARVASSQRVAPSTAPPAQQSAPLPPPAPPVRAPPPPPAAPSSSSPPPPRFAYAGESLFRSLLRDTAGDSRKDNIVGDITIDLWPREKKDADAIKTALLSAGAVEVLPHPSPVATRDGGNRADSTPSAPMLFQSRDRTVVRVAVEVGGHLCGGGGGGVESVVAGFNVGLEAVGCDVERNTVSRVFVSELAIDSVRMQEPHLVLVRRKRWYQHFSPAKNTTPHLVNEAHLLATAERVMRFSRLMGWSRPKQQLDFLLTRWNRAVSKATLRAEHVDRYRLESADRDARAEVCKAFGLDFW